MKKITNHLVKAAMMLAMMLTLTACPPDDNNNTIIDEPGNNVTSGLPSQSEMENLIAKHVKVNATYLNYYWIFKVESTLHKDFPNRSLEFGIGHGDINGTTTVSSGYQLNGAQNQYSNYSEYYDSNNVFHAELKCPIEFYFMFGKNPQDLSAFTLCATYNREYQMLISKGSSLTSEERQRVTKLKNYLKRYEDEVLANYDLSLQIWMDKRKSYVIGYYNR